MTNSLKIALKKIGHSGTDSTSTYSSVILMMKIMHRKGYGGVGGVGSIRNVRLSKFSILASLLKNVLEIFMDDKLGVAIQ